MKKPYSTACDRNKDAILGVLKKLIEDKSQILFEVASGTGQHAVYMAPHFPKLTWIVSDLISKHKGIKQWLDQSDTPNIQGPVEYEVGKNTIPYQKCDIIFTANSFHIMSLDNVRLMIKSCSDVLTEKGLFIIYGPFNYNGEYTSQSNCNFDKLLYSKNLNSAIRNFEEVKHDMELHGLSLYNDFEMPANNRMLVFQSK
jgi:cyclopropane fatty-acyl-phospholipid synthase-like methyltransferase